MRPDGAAAPVLELAGVVKRYGELEAVAGVDLVVQRGERHALIGPNGAGKTTLFDLIGGGNRVTEGSLRFEGHDVTRLSEHRRARRGMAKTFQHSNLFDGLSVRENVAIAVQFSLGVAHRLLRPVGRHPHVVRRVEELVERVGLADVAEASAGALSHGERRQLEVAVALATRPTLLLLDEPTAGMSPAESEAFVGMIDALADDLTVLIIEHDMDVVFALATRVTVLHAGRVLADGPPEEVQASDEVQEAYLGAGHQGELFIVDAS